MNEKKVKRCTGNPAMVHLPSNISKLFNGKKKNFILKRQKFSLYREGSKKVQAFLDKLKRREPSRYRENLSLKML